jgi:hypothetical protein
MEGEAQTGANPWVEVRGGINPKASRMRRKSHNLKKDRLHTSNSVVALELLRLNGQDRGDDSAETLNRSFRNKRVRSMWRDPLTPILLIV